MHGLVPDYLTNVITMQIEVTNRETRSCNENNVHVPSVNLEFTKNSFSYILVLQTGTLYLTPLSSVAV